ncbi:MAG: MerR family transcriptional regulator [Gemmatimonadota bacterium]|nr:MerR family transcriptional regulator [Gemmatimonadota bacterium]MDE2784148.1 MerR family transcriptional regulator [Gemmatimonadota bacterium]MDE2863921.1 MerR family transcriptional regulator [Gemmatimonadota bacterium]MXV95027.1 MerR family transcriptional regulator [Gemmatimonadota bacterium]MYB07581.1 MerR family transcriptional regulator [Gemmatimonadota bacterium]
MEPIIRKTYYSIGEVSDLTGLKPHVLRYWETQFDILSPTKNRGGTRVYRNREIESILLVKHLLYEKRFTIEGAKRELQEMRDGGRMAEVRKLNAEPAVLAAIKDGLTALREELTLPQREDQGT